MPFSKVGLQQQSCISTMGADVCEPTTVHLHAGCPALYYPLPRCRRLSPPQWGISTTAQIPEPDTDRPMDTVYRLHRVKERKTNAVELSSSPARYMTISTVFLSPWRLHDNPKVGLIAGDDSYRHLLQNRCVCREWLRA